MQCRHQRCDLTGGAHGTESLDLFIDDGLHRCDLATALGESGFGEAPEVVHVEQGDSREISSCRIDITRYGHIDHEDRTTVTNSHDTGEIGVFEDHRLGAGSGHEEINFGQRCIEIGQADRTPAETLGNLGRIVEGAIGDADVGDTVGGERTNHALAHLSGTHDKDAAAFELAEVLGGHGNGCGGHRRDMTTDLRFGSHSFANLERVTEQQIDLRTRC
ncbi:unannotated protein [freshwater metagenome]|uniref:Unannotated protein n=1 Tax=freshwater metagenome TaxID=449393 RepID=A0A6J5YI29_9ZZZZ